jgi:CRP-like cAMP-binding protein
MRVTDLLRTMDIFEALPAEELATIASLLREQRLRETEVLCRQGEVGDALFIVTGGRIRLSASDPSGHEKVLTHFTDGQFFGEMALLTGAPRSATATAATDAQVLVLGKHDFDNLLASHPQILREMLKVVSQRTVQTNQQLLAEEPRSNVVVGSGRVYAVFSPRGGAGKTTIAVNLAVRQALEHPDRTALLDLDVTFGQVPALLGIESNTSLADVLAETLADFDRRTLATYLVEHESGLRVLAAARRPEQGELVTAGHVRAALGTMKRQFSATIVDCGSNFDEATIAALELADHVIVICTPELTTLRDIRECQRLFGEIVHLNADRLCFILNHPQPFSVLPRDRFEATLDQQMSFVLPHAGDLAYKAAAAGQPLAAHHAGSPFVKALDKLRHTLVPVEARASRPSTGLLGMLRLKRAG